MKTLLSILLLAVAVMVFINVWSYADSSNIEDRNREQYGGDSSVVDITTPPETTEAEITTEKVVTEKEPTAYARAKLFFGGDINLDPEYSASERYINGDENIKNCFSTTILGLVRDADMFMVGNVFAFTDNADPIDKVYTFRTEKKHAQFLDDLGVDVVSLANNHSFDYSVAGYVDTVDALDDLGIVSVGAGFNVADAAKPYYANINGITVAFTAAMRSEKYIDTPEASATSAGVMKMYDIEAYANVICEAKANADFVIAYVHWGTENTITLEDEQIEGAKALIDAGADAVIGAHSHTVQPIEIYKGKPIFYSLGDMFSTEDNKESGLVRLIIDSNGNLEASFIPCESIGGYVDIASEDTSRALFGRLNESDTISLSNNGSIAEK